MPFSQQMFQQKLLEFIEVCNDGYAILSADDKMLGCIRPSLVFFIRTNAK